MLIVFFFVVDTSYSLSLGKLNFLKQVTFDSDEKELHLRVEFRKVYTKKVNPQYLTPKNAIQFEFPNTYTHPPKRSFTVNDELITKVLVYQYQKDIVKMQIFFAEKNKDIINRISSELLGTTFVVSMKKPEQEPVVVSENIQQPELESLKKDPDLVSQDSPQHMSKSVEQEPSFVPTETLKPEMESLSKETEKTNKLSASDPALIEEGDLFHEENLSENSVFPLKPNVESIASPDLYTSSVKMLASLAFIVGIILLVYYLARNFLGKGRFHIEREGFIKVLTTSRLGQKKEITLVEVMGEIMLLGISDNHISLLTKFKKGEKQVGVDMDSFIFDDKLKIVGQSETEGTFFEPLPKVVKSVREKIKELHK